MCSGDGVPDPLCEPFEPLSVGAFREVAGDGRVDGLAGDCLRPVSGQQHEREVWCALGDRTREFDPVHPGHLVVADHTVDGRRRQPVERGLRVGDTCHDEPADHVL